jgi:hypothetical protein
VTTRLQIVVWLNVAGACWVLPLGLLASEPTASPAISVKQGVGGHLNYTADANGNRVIDFSYAGYGGGGEAIPLVPVKIVVGPEGFRDGERIQAALDLVAALPAGPDGFRGAVLLKPGRYVIEGHLRISVSGVVLRGSGESEMGTVLVASGVSRRTLIEVSGQGDREEFTSARRNVTDPYVPVGATRLSVEDSSCLHIGARVAVRRPSGAEWIASIGMNEFTGWEPENRVQWGPGSRDLVWERTVVGIEGNVIELDAPITTALDRAQGGGTVVPCSFVGRIDRVGVENLRCVSEFDATRPQDEEHAWNCISLDKVENAWVRQITAEHFVGYVIDAQADSKSLTIEDCTAIGPVSELAAYRRRVFSIAGQLTLVQRCRSERGLHDFTTGFSATGPNVFSECTARDALDWSGPLESWASGVLYENVIIRGNALRFLNRGADGQGAGWTTANSVLWNCEATEIQVQSPKGAPNQAYFCKGLVVDDRLIYDPQSMPYPGFVRSYSPLPLSLYRAQLAERKGAAAVNRLERSAISVSGAGARALAVADVPPPVRPVAVHPLRVEGGWFVIDGRRAWTGRTDWSWFLGQMPRNLARQYGPAITRFAPGETGTGLTDNLEEVVANMPPGSAFVQCYGLWYDRRRINHDFYGSPELPAGDVSGPFMEMPWARSGYGTDWDGMSKYDLTRYNPWFFQRVKDFGILCDANGRILYYNFYCQHALQETRAHYVDFPWRPVNCLQPTDMPDENPAGAAFYDVSNGVRRDLHRRYIRHCLDVLKGSANVVYGVDQEYSGPLSFVQFWLDTIADWEKENDRKVYIALDIPKAEMDAILADPVRGPMISAIDFRKWFYRPDGSLYTVIGGINQAPREQAINIPSDSELQKLRQRMSDPKSYPGWTIIWSDDFWRMIQDLRDGSPAMRYRAWREYRDEFPEVVLLDQVDEFPTLTAAIGRNIPAATRALMRPAAVIRGQRGTSWAIAIPGKDYLVYTMDGKAVELDLTKERETFRLSWLDSASNAMQPESQEIRGGGNVTIRPPGGGTERPWVAWLAVQP